MFRNSSNLKKYRNVIKFKKNNINISFSTETNVPKQADVVIVGGGVIGCSVFYHLCKKGVQAILLEKHKVTSGTTWHSNAIVWSLRGNDVDTIFLQKTRQLMLNLENETGVSPGWINNGGIFIARTKERLEEYKQFHTLGQVFGIESRLVSPSEAQKLCPLLNPESFYGALWAPSDGFTDPSMYCASLIKGAISNGGKLFEDTAVTNVLTETSMNNRKKIIAIETSQGQIKTNVLVNTCGAWSRGIAQMVGSDLPMTAFKHAIILTGGIPSAKGTPCVRDHDESLVFRPQGECIIFGAYEKNPEIIKDLPEDFKFSLYEIDLTLFETHWARGCELCPSFEKAGIKTDVYGPESFTPDHRPLMGEDPECVGLYHGCGFNSLGMNLSGGAGDQLASWVTLGRPDLPPYSYDIRRFSPRQRRDRAWITETSHESYVKSYSIGHPHGQPLAGRNYKTDPFHKILVENGAVMEQAEEWERPAYFIKNGVAPVGKYDWYGSYEHPRNEDTRYEKEIQGDITFEFSKHHELIKEECLAARNTVAMFNQSSYTKMILTGPDAKEAADWLFTADLDKNPGSVIYTLSLNCRGGVEANVNVIPLEAGKDPVTGFELKENSYYIMDMSRFGGQVQYHLEKELYLKNLNSSIMEVTDKTGVLSVQGPKSRELLQSCTECSLTNENFPYGTSKLIDIDGHICRILRISNIGELGFEIHIPAGSCLKVFNKIIDCGKNFDLKFGGFRALDSLNCEKGGHHLNYDLRIDDNPVEAGLSGICKIEGQYLGKEFVERVREEGVKKRKVFFILCDPIALYGFETIWRDDKIVGFLRRGQYGFSLDCSIGIGYIKHPEGTLLDDEYIKSGTYHIEVRDKKYPANVFLNSPFDPSNQRILGHY